MRCSTCRKLGIIEEEGHLDAARQLARQRHLDRCPRCREADRQDGILRVHLTAAPPPGPRRDLWPVVAARLALRPQRRPSVVRRAWRPALALATVATATGLALSLYSGLQRVPGPGEIGPQLVPTNARIVSEDPWAGDVARALDVALTQDSATG